MNLKKFFIVLISFVFLIFNQNFFATAKVIYPDEKLSQPMPEDTYPGPQENMNYEQTKIIRENLDNSEQTLDFQKLENTAKKDDNIFFSLANQSNRTAQIFIFFMALIFVFVLGLRFFQKK